MRRFLLLVFLFNIFVNDKVVAQTNSCKVSAFTFTIKSSIPNPNGAGCQITADISFSGEFTNGSKGFYIHLWESSPINNYPNIIYFPSGSGAGVEPTASQLANALGTIIIENPGGNNNQLKIGTSYLGTNAKVLIPTGIKRTGNSPNFSYILEGVSLVVSNCGAEGFSIQGDVWGANNNNNVQCAVSGGVIYGFNPAISGVMTCLPNNRNYSVTINNTKSSVPVTGSYSVFLDDGDGVFEPSVPISGETNDVLIKPSSTVTVAANSSSTISGLTYEPYSQTMPDAMHDLFIQSSFTSSLGSRDLNGIKILNGCTVLPVKLSSFTATRSRTAQNQVELKWETAMEQNNKGFYLQRKTAGEWQDIGFVFSAADGGNSNTPLRYSFKDMNASKGVSHYRMYQIDHDGMADYSEVKSVPGVDNGAAGVLVFPNPATNGKVTLLFPDAAKRNIVLSDGAGKVLQQFRNHNGNSLTIERLKPGFYTVKISDEQSGKTFAEKIIVQ